MTSPDEPSPEKPAISPPGESLDQPLDALVYEVHPAFMPRAAAGTEYSPDYPYARQAAGLPPPTGEGSALLSAANSAAVWLARTSESYFAALQSPPDFAVPKTFGMSAILGIMTALALLFACLRWMNAEPVFYFFFSVEALTICLAQMLHGKAPRLASIAAGALLLPAFSILAAMWTGNAGPAMICLAVGFVPFGAILGYLTGTCAAGTFLVMDYIERSLQGRAVLPPSGEQTCSR